MTHVDLVYATTVGQALEIVARQRWATQAWVRESSHFLCLCLQLGVFAVQNQMKNRAVCRIAIDAFSLPFCQPSILWRIASWYFFVELLANMVRIIRHYSNLKSENSER